ncbi:hypothetical protein ACB092_11G183900 [Castanea dentata]
MSFPPSPFPYPPSPPLPNDVGTSPIIYDTSFISPPPPPPHPSSSSMNPSILIIVLIFFVTVVASVSLCLLLRHLNRRCLRHLSNSSTTTTTTTTLTSSASESQSQSHALSNRRVSPENPKSTIIDSLPLFAFSSITRRSNSTSADCAVCLSKFEPNDQLRLLPLCCHAFHAECIDTWLGSNQTCPLCRSAIVASESDIMKSTGAGASDSFRLEIGNVSRRIAASDSGEAGRRSYSIGSFDYLVDDDSEISVSHAHRRSVSDKDDSGVLRTRPAPPSAPPELDSTLGPDVAAGRSWLKDYIDRFSASISSRAMSFRSSGRFFSGSSRRSEVSGAGEWDLESNRVGEEITEMFRWLSDRN